MQKKPGLSSLRNFFSRAEGPDGFEDLPQKLEETLAGLDSRDLEPAFRADIFDLLTRTTEICYLLSKQSYDGFKAAALCADLHALAARLMLHLMSRPTSTSYGILFPRTGTLYEVFYGTQEEAEKSLKGLHRVGLREDGEVVPVTVTSTRLAQPKAPREDTADVIALATKIEEAQ